MEGVEPVATRNLLPSGRPRTILVVAIALVLIAILVLALWVGFGRDEVIAPTALPSGASPTAG